MRFTILSPERNHRGGRMPAVIILFDIERIVFAKTAPSHIQPEN
ncbi:MAG: hypothetical protein AAGE80_01950 [Pseudomonadota bacterium]